MIYSIPITQLETAVKQHTGVTVDLDATSPASPDAVSYIIQVEFSDSVSGESFSEGKSWFFNPAGGILG